mgnify:FL=1
MNLNKAKEKFFKILFALAAALCIVAVIAIFAFLIIRSLPTFRRIGFLNFVFGKEWKPNVDDGFTGEIKGKYGVFKMIIGTIAATIGSVTVGGLLGFFTAVFLSAFCPKKLKGIFGAIINLLAGIPSVVFGFFGMTVLLPLLGNFSDTGSGSGLLAVSLVLGLMILPTVTSLSRTSIDAVPAGYYEGARALGATHEQAVFRAVVPAAKSGIVASIILGVGRAVGETMAVIMVAGNVVEYPKGLFQSFRVLTTNIVMEMGYAGDLQLGALIATGVVLLIFILIINALTSLASGGKKDKNCKKRSIEPLAKFFHIIKIEKIGKVVAFVSAGVAVLGLLSILVFVSVKGIPHLSAQLLFGKYSVRNVSILPSIVATLLTVLISLIVAAPIGVFTAVFLNEYTKKGSKAVKVIRTAIDILSGIPSIVYALFGMVTFVVWLGGKQSILAGSLTIAIMLLPTVVRSTKESLKSVPDGLREGSLALGAGKVRTVFKVVLPSALPGIASAIILAMGRVVSESAPFIYTMGNSLKGMPAGVTDSGTTLAVALYRLAGEGRFVNQAYATAFVLIVVVLSLNAIADLITKKLDKKLKGSKDGK